MVSYKIFTLFLVRIFHIFNFISKLITHFIINFTLGEESQSITYLLCGNKLIHIYWISDLEVEVHLVGVANKAASFKNARATFF